jgi:rhomboid protease GluP
LINEKYQKGLFTIILLVANVLLFIFFDLIHTGGGIRFFADNFGLTTFAVLQEGEYYRFITSTFVHFNIVHLANNMLLLGVLGYNLEQEKGHIKFLIIYLGSGLGGNFLSFAMRNNFNEILTPYNDPLIRLHNILVDITSGPHILSGGASGAVFGLMGAVLGIYLKTKQPVGRLAGRGLVVMVVISLYLGLTDTGIDNAAHIGGLIFGFVIALFFRRRGLRG